MDLLYEACAGIDVHRDTLVVTTVRAVGSRRESETRTFEAVTEGVRAMVAWLDEQQIPIVAMESTGVYWKPAYRAVRALSPQRTVWLINPSQVKAVPGRKTDVKDSAWIAKLLMHGLVRPSFVPALDARIASLLEPMKEACGLLTDVPGINDVSAAGVLAEIGADMSVFPSADHLVSWGGLAPGSHESAGKRKAVATRRGSHWLRVFLVQCAWAATHAKGSFWKRKFERLRARLGPQQALVAIARKMLVAIFHILKDRVPYREVLLPGAHQRHRAPLPAVRVARGGVGRGAARDSCRVHPVAKCRRALLGARGANGTTFRIRAGSARHRAFGRAGRRARLRPHGPGHSLRLSVHASASLGLDPEIGTPYPLE